MESKFEYKTIEKRNSIIESNNTLFLIREENITEGNFLIFSDALIPISEEQQLKQITQDRINKISEYASLDNNSVEYLENTILEYEKNKIINGGM